jgi:hypothetical protein
MLSKRRLIGIYLALFLRNKGNDLQQDSQPVRRMQHADEFCAVG